VEPGGGPAGTDRAGLPSGSAGLAAPRPASAHDPDRSSAPSAPTPELDLARLLHDSRAALKALFRASRLSPPDGEDILQEAQMILLRRFRYTQDVTDPPSFLCGTVKNGIQRHFERQRRERCVRVDAARLEGLGGSACPQRQSDSRHNARKLLARLPRRSRRIVEMRYGPGLSSRDIARQAGGSETGVRKTASRGLQRLRRYAAAMRSHC
jgi:RNA polymerase sigma factor (sigma-70 family)